VQRLRQVAALEPGQGGLELAAQLVEIGRTEDAFRGPHHPDAEAFSPPSPIRMSRLPGHGFGSPAPSQAQQRQP